MPADIQGILEGLRLGEVRRQNAITNKLAQQKADQQNEQEQARLEEERNFHKAQTEHQRAILKATEAVHAATRLAELQKIGQAYQEGAPAPAGSQVFPGTPDQQGNRTDTIQLPIESDQQVPGIIGNIPLPTTPIQVQSPDTYARQFAQRQETVNAPAIAKANAIEAQKAADALVKQKELTDFQGKKQAEHDAALENLRHAHDIVLENIAAGHDAARIRAANPSELSGSVLRSYLERARNGQITLNELKKEIPLKAQGDFFAAAADAGIGFIDDKQKELLGTFRPAYAAIAKADELNDLMSNDRGLGLKIGTENWKRARTLQKEINESLVSAAQALGQQRLSDPRVKAMTDAYSPTLNPLFGSPANNKKTRNDLNNYILDTLSDKLSNLPRMQRDMFIGALQKSARDEVQGVKVLAPNGKDIVFVHPEDVQKAVASGGKVIQ